MLTMLIMLALLALLSLLRILALFVLLIVLVLFVSVLFFGVVHGELLPWVRGGKAVKVFRPAFTISGNVASDVGIITLPHERVVAG